MDSEAGSWRLKTEDERERERDRTMDIRMERD